MSRGTWNFKKILGVDRNYFLLFLLIIFNIINNLVILSRDNTPLLWDGGGYFYSSLRYYDVFLNQAPDFMSRFNEVSPYRPPLFMLSSIPFYMLFDRSPDVAVMTNTLYLIILVFSIYGIGKKFIVKRQEFLQLLLYPPSQSFLA